MRTMRLEVKVREQDVGEAPTLKLEIEEEETGTWVLTARYYFTDNYAFAIKVFQDGDGYMAVQVPFHAWENVYKNVLEIISEEIDEEIAAEKELGTYTDLVFRLEANEKSTYHLAEKIATAIKQKYPDLFQ
ncbi:MAG: hypothetical protein QW707_08335 [Candidatus Bathyarchaeia archaeon]